MSLSADRENLYTCKLSSHFRAQLRNFQKIISVMEAWPFLFSKCAGLERKVIVMPEVLRGEDAARLIEHVTAPTLSDGETKVGEGLFLREVPHSTLGPLHAVFRNRRASAADLGRAPDKYFPEYLTEGFVAHGAEPRFAYSQAHFETLSQALTPKLRQCEQSDAWREAAALCDLKLQLSADASPKLKLTGVHGGKGSARACFADLLNGWKSEARQARSDLAGAGNGNSETWAARLRRALPEHGPKRALVFAVVAGVAVGGVLAWQRWKHRQGQEGGSTRLERV